MFPVSAWLGPQYEIQVNISMGKNKVAKLAARITITDSFGERPGTWAWYLAYQAIEEEYRPAPVKMYQQKTTFQFKPENIPLPHHAFKRRTCNLLWHHER